MTGKVLQNIRLEIEYDGEDYVGWQRQDPLPTIQGVLETTIGKVLGRRVIVYGSGRTDSGVHARGQVGNFYADRHRIPCEKWTHVLNTKLPRNIRILGSREVDFSFNAQKNARGKVYEYRVLNRQYSSALHRRVYFCPFPLDWNRIEEALPHFIGEKDFISFLSGPKRVKSTVRRINRFELFRESDGFYRFEVEGNGFLKQMVRNMIGTVLEVGQGLCAPSDIEGIIRSAGRQFAGRTVPPQGLCLLKVFYDDEQRK